LIVLEIPHLKESAGVKRNQKGLKTPSLSPLIRGSKISSPYEGEVKEGSKECTKKSSAQFIMFCLAD